MPPRGAPRGRGGPPPPGPPRGGPPMRGGPPGAAPMVASHVQTVGVRRPGVGKAGKQVSVITNHFPVTIPEGIIHHYDVIDNNADKKYPARLNMEIVKAMQLQHPNTFTPKVVYDGRKNVFSPRELDFNGQSAAEFPVVLGQPTPGRTGPKPFRVRLIKVAEINPESLARYLNGKQSHENDVLTAITALNVVIRMDPSMKYTFNVRSFFTPQETKVMPNSAIDLWRGYFQSVRPAVGRMLVNIDISTATMYRPGPLINNCLAHIRAQQPTALFVGTIQERTVMMLTRFFMGCRVTTTIDPSKPPRTIKKFMYKDNANKTFSMTTPQGERTITIARYFEETFQKRVQFPTMILVEVGKNAYVPLEFLVIPPGQILKKQVPPELTKEVLEFATKKPSDRLQSIRNGLNTLNYKKSEYLDSFGMVVDESQMVTNARVLVPPTLRYGQGSKQPTLIPRDGQWNMADKKFVLCSSVKAWAVIVYERKQRFDENNVRDMIAGLRGCARDVGISGFDSEPMVEWQNGQGDIQAQLKGLGMKCKQKFGILPTILFCVLPEGSTDMYNAIKHFGDIAAGVATQCLKSIKCSRAKVQYYANVLLKVNVKLGGVNVVPDASSVPIFSDPNQPVLVMGADVIHPAPGSEGRPSFTALVGNVDSNVSKYVATSCVQTSRKEIIEDMGAMTKHIVGMYRRWRENVEKKKIPWPTRVILYRDGVSEGQFQTVLDEEVPEIKKAFAEMNITPVPKLTVVVVGKRHHVRMFPTSGGMADKSGNCPSGTVIDTDIVHPTEFDFYLQSHGGLLGTSRPAHYSILYDENQFTADNLQQLSFALCHVFARSTRAVSVPSPVYYADIVCSRARTHYDPAAQLALHFSSEDMTGTGTGDKSQEQARLQRYKEAFRPLHANTSILMYFT